MQTSNTKRTVVTVDDRRAVIVLARAKARTPNEILKVPHEAFLRQALKARMGYTPKDSAPDSIKDAAKQMAASILADAKAAVEAFKAKHEVKAA
jgi:hypothetical protein